MTGYVLKMYPRFSETFVVAEILELERRGRVIDIASLRKPDDGRFHEDLARVRAAVAYLPESFRHAPGTFLAAHLSVLASRPRSWLRSALDAARYGRHARGGFLRAPLLARLAVARGWTRMHAHFADLPAAATLFAARWTGLPFTVTAHAKDLYQQCSSRSLVRALLGEAERVVTVSEFNRRFLERLDPSRAAGKVARVYNGVDLARFRPADPDESGGPGSPLVLAVGRLVEKKGFDVLIEACAALAALGADFHCEIVGKGPEQGALEAAVRRRGLAGRVRLVGPLPRGEVAARLRVAAVLAVPCVVAGDGNRDGLPTVIVEANAAGIPTVATDVTGIPEAVIDRESGRLVPPGDADAFARALLSVLGDPDARARMGRRARRLAEERFDLSRNVADLDRLFGEDGRRRPDLPAVASAPAAPGVSS